MVKMLIMQVCSKEYIDFFLLRNSLIPMALALDVLKNINGIIICYNGYCLKTSHQRLKTSFSPFSSIFGISYLRKLQLTQVQIYEHPVFASART